MASESRASVRLGWAIHERADDIAAAVVERAESFPPDSWPGREPEVLDAIAETDRLAARVLGRWLATGEAVTREENRQLAALGLLAETVPLSCLVKLYLAWRDVTLAIVEEEARRVGIEREIVEEVRALIARSNDASIVRMSKQFDDERRRLEEELAARQQELAHQALHDSLTGLANRALLFERLEKALEATRRYAESLALFFIDLDGFKNVNDTLGHDAGDKLLLATAGRLQGIVRPSDTVARLGGDEFVILCERLESGADEAVAIAGRTLAVVAKPYRLADEEVSISASVGIAIAAVDEDPDTLVTRADHAMYAAKRRGGSNHEMHAGPDSRGLSPALDQRSSTDVLRGRSRDEVPT
jgi:diguanylate cyclase (GGDEF)-like protein